MSTFKSIHRFRQDRSKWGHSQNGEAPILSEILRRLKLKKGSAVEFGAPDPYYCSNIQGLPDTWEKTFYDNLSDHPGVIKETITTENINSVIGECDVLSIDTDGPDWELWKAYKYTPSVVIIEINSSIIPDQEHFSYERGASFKTMNKLAESKGYFLLCHIGNCIYIRNEFKELFPDADHSFDKSWL